MERLGASNGGSSELRRLLLIEDDESLSDVIRLSLKSAQYDVICCVDGHSGLETAKNNNIDLVLCDVHLPDMSGLEITQALHKQKAHLPIIVMSGFATSSTAIEATRNGAYDFLLKPFPLEDLLAILDQAWNASNLRCKQVTLDAPDAGEGTMIGKSKVMQDVFKQVGRLADRSMNVVIRGETGTGKEMIARALFQYGDRSAEPFIPVNCAAIPETLLESELFGHERGAFTGAHSTRIGRFEQAKNGTIFLDEIGEMSVATQSKLLRVLQEKRFQRLGSKSDIATNARVIAATSRDLLQAIQKNEFREDLFYRLSEAEIYLPPLRERGDDLRHLINTFLLYFGKEFGVERPSIQKDAMEFLLRQSWPGNVRELRNAVRKALIASKGYPVSLEHVQSAAFNFISAGDVKETGLGEFIRRQMEAAARGEASNIMQTLINTLEKEAYEMAITLARGNQSRAAGWLGVSLPTMRERLMHFGLHPKQPLFAKTNGGTTAVSSPDTSSPAKPKPPKRKGKQASPRKSA